MQVDIEHVSFPLTYVSQHNILYVHRHCYIRRIGSFFKAE